MLVKVQLVLAIASLAFCQFDERFKERMRINPEAKKPRPLPIVQPLDHFNPLSNVTLITRSLYNDQFAKPGGPIVVYVGGEWGIADYGAMGGVAFQVAKKHGGFIFYPEHRFFGQSFPTNFEDPFSKEALVYLSVEQVLADMVFSINYVKEHFEVTKNSQVVLVGGSYAGALSVWARLKYPDTISMAYACGGVTRSSLDNKDYYDIIYKSYVKQDPACAQFLKDGLKEAAQMLKSPEGKRELIRLLEGWLCYHRAYELTNTAFMHKLLFTLNSQLWFANEWGDLCRYVKANENNGSLIQRFTDVAVRTSSNKRELGKCEDQTDIDRQWFWLSCTGMGNVAFTTPEDFGEFHSLDEELQTRCEKTYGFKREFVEERVRKFKEMLGSHTPDTTKIVMTQGTQDPWYKSTMMDETNDQIRVIYVEGVSHCPDLGEEQPNETGKVVQVKHEVMDALAEWINT